MVVSKDQTWLNQQKWWVERDDYPLVNVDITWKITTFSWENAQTFHRFSCDANLKGARHGCWGVLGCPGGPWKGSMIIEPYWTPLLVNMAPSLKFTHQPWIWWFWCIPYYVEDHDDRMIPVKSFPDLSVVLDKPAFACKRKGMDQNGSTFSSGPNRPRVFLMLHIWFVVYLPLWHIRVNWDDYSQHMDK